MLLAHLARCGIRSGRLTIVDAYGRRHQVGGSTGLHAAIRLHDRLLPYQLCWNPYLHLGEAYMDGRLTIEEGDLRTLLEMLATNEHRLERHGLVRSLKHMRYWVRRLQQHNPIRRARVNVEHHYDLSKQLYNLFLDSDRQYSCGYFTHDHDDLERAQHDKKRHLAAKLRLGPGQRVLDIGSGWGGLALTLAEAGADEVLGITLSKEQHVASRERAAEAGLDDRVTFELRDYREQTGRFDRIVSVGMFEHVGVPHYAAFFSKIRDLLTDDGIAVVHSIGRMDGPSYTNPWTRKYIFPGGYTPALSEVLPVVEHLGLWLTDVEILRLHYAETLRLWRRRFEAHRDEVNRLYDERFSRMWEFYLIGAELGFRRGHLMVFQLQLAKTQDAVPLTRDYITDWERSHVAGMDLAAE